LSFSDRSQLNLCRPLAGVTKRKADADTDTAPASQNGYRGLCRSGDHLFKSRNALGELCRFERLHKRIKQLRDFHWHLWECCPHRIRAAFSAHTSVMEHLRFAFNSPDKTAERCGEKS
jgi:hypothetical protein